MMKLIRWLLVAFFAVMLWSIIHPHDLFTWFLEALPALIALVKSEKELEADQAAQVLGKIGPPATAAVPALIDALKSRKRISTIQALGEIRSSDSVSILTELLKDPDPNVRQYSAVALGEIRTEAAVPPLLEALKDKMMTFAPAA